MAEITINPPLPGHDHSIVKYNGVFIGYRGLKKLRIALQRCPKCSRENYVLAVADGVCCWCGFDINKVQGNE